VSCSTAHIMLFFWADKAAKGLLAYNGLSHNDDLMVGVTSALALLIRFDLLYICSDLQT